MFHESTARASQLPMLFLFLHKASGHVKNMYVHGANLHILILKAAFLLKIYIFIMLRNDTKGKPKKKLYIVTN